MTVRRGWTIVCGCDCPYVCLCVNGWLCVNGSLSGWHPVGVYGPYKRYGKIRGRVGTPFWRVEWRTKCWVFVLPILRCRPTLRLRQSPFCSVMFVDVSTWQGQRKYEKLILLFELSSFMERKRISLDNQRGAVATTGPVPQQYIDNFRCS